MNNKKYCIESYFDNIDTKEKAYVLGLWVADGHLDKEGRFGFWSTDIELVNIVKSTLQSEHKIYEYQNKKFANAKTGYSIKIMSKQMATALRGLGYDNNKSFSATYPNIPKELDSHFIRGVMDGDGSVCVEKARNLLYVQFCGTKPLMVGIYKKIPLGESLATIYQDKRSPSVHIMRFRGTYAKPILDWVYKDSEGLRLTRKYNNYASTNEKGERVMKHDYNVVDTEFLCRSRITGQFLPIYFGKEKELVAGQVLVAFNIVAEIDYMIQLGMDVSQYKFLDIKRVLPFLFGWDSRNTLDEWGNPIKISGTGLKDWATFFGQNEYADKDTRDLIILHQKTPAERDRIFSKFCTLDKLEFTDEEKEDISAYCDVNELKGGDRTKYKAQELKNKNLKRNRDYYANHFGLDYENDLVPYFTEAKFSDALYKVIVDYCHRDVKATRYFLDKCIEANPKYVELQVKAHTEFVKMCARGIPFHTDRLSTLVDQRSNYIMKVKDTFNELFKTLIPQSIERRSKLVKIEKVEGYKLSGDALSNYLIDEGWDAIDEDGKAVVCQELINIYRNDNYEYDEEGEEYTPTSIHNIVGIANKYLRGESYYVKPYDKEHYEHFEVQIPFQLFNDKYKENTKGLKDWFGANGWPYVTDKGAVKITKDLLREVRVKPYDGMTDKVKEVVEEYLKYKRALGNELTYIDNEWFEYTIKNGRSYPVYTLGGTDTGRAETPTSTFFLKWDQKYYKGFMAGEKIVQVDLKSAEVLIGAMFTGDTALLDAYASGDIYNSFIEQAGLWEYLAPLCNDDATKVRFMAKQIFLSIQYGAGAYSISSNTSIPIEVVKKIIKKYNTTYPVRVQFANEIMYMIMEEKVDCLRHYDELIFPVPPLPDNLESMNWKERTKFEGTLRNKYSNTPIQGGCAILLYYWIEECHKLKLEPIASVHDCLAFDVDKFDKATTNLALDNAWKRFVVKYCKCKNYEKYPMIMEVEAIETKNIDDSTLIGKFLLDICK